MMLPIASLLAKDRDRVDIHDAAGVKLIERIIGRGEMRTIDIHEAKANLCRLVEQAAQGQSFMIATYGRPRVMVIGLDSIEAGHLRCHGLLERCVTVAKVIDPRDETETEQLFG
ncbi:type II toxin-antitoxin system Phd/YefM family antitoxin [Steroidobacter flavus]|uniref:Type II toxin-antitoxin system Phd/YefM family antitoxin n=1 Tax=Steroidobacter flavus TaxID=1842136 RepID=A0ABV8SZD0_9GAMM